MRRQISQVSRRTFIKSGLTMGGAAYLGVRSTQAGRRRRRKKRGDDGRNGNSTPFDFVPFTRSMPVPPVIEPISAAGRGLNPPPGSDNRRPFDERAIFHGIAPEYHPAHPAHAADWQDPRYSEKHFYLNIEETHAEIIPGVDTPVFSYNGMTPGPTFIARFREPFVVRVANHIESECSVHLHGSHTPAHADGYPDFYVLPEESRDYYYPNIVQRRFVDGEETDEFDISEVPSTMWYHDHGMDLTGFNVSRGLAGFYLMVDDLEEELMASGVLPDLFSTDGLYDIPIVIQDQKFNRDGSLEYDFLDHNGRLGDVFVVNGKAQPRFQVERRKYRFRILNGSNARVYNLRLTSGLDFLQIGKDSWLLPEPFVRRDITMWSGERADVIIDFRDAPDEVYLENWMEQKDGRGPDRVRSRARTPLLKFDVVGPARRDDITVDIGTPLREHHPIQPSEITVTREFEFDRSNGAWTMNGEFFNPRRADAVPRLGGAERWIFVSKSGGWGHPIHMHLTGAQTQRVDGRRPALFGRNGFKEDMVVLDDDTDEVEVFYRFATFTGPYAFHCHTVEHEDMRMMGAFDPAPAGGKSPLDGRRPISAEISGIPEDLHVEGLFEEVGDVDRLEGRGVGFPKYKRGGERYPPED